MSDGIDRLCAALRSAGIDMVFGVPGTQTVALFDGFRRHRIRTVLSTHELAAAFMANGHYRSTGRLGVLVTIPGPGFTYALTGLAEARLDSAAVLHLVGTPATAPGRAFQLQRIDQTSIAAPIVKRSFRLESRADAERTVRDACVAALGGEPGPVLLELDIARLGAMHAPRADEGESMVAAGMVPSRDALEDLSKSFAAASRPVFYAGAGAFGAAAELERIATSLRIPVLTTPSARGIVPEDSAVAMGFDPLKGGVAAANALLGGADLIVALGCKLGHNGSAGFALQLGREKLVHVDASAEVPGANYDTRLSIVARVEEVMPSLASRMSASRWTDEELGAARTAMRTPQPDSQEPVLGAGNAMTPAQFFSRLRAMLPRDAIVVTDSGQHQILARRHLDVLSSRGLIAPSDFQSMGFGLPAAIGAKLAAPERAVIALVGDGGFLMSGLELLTAKREGVGVVVIVFNDGHLSQIRVQQRREFGHAHAVDLLNPDFGAMAEAMGVGYVRFDEARPQEIESAMVGRSPMLVEVPVRDSLGALAAPVKARAKTAARRVLTPRLWAWLKASLRR